MAQLTAGERAADRMLSHRSEVAGAVTAALCAKLPHLQEKYGNHGRARCLEDIHFNLEHLAGAVALESPETFAGYIRWVDGLLQARGVPTDELGRSLELVGDHLRPLLSADQAAAAEPCLAAGLEALRR